MENQRYFDFKSPATFPLFHHFSTWLTIWVLWLAISTSEKVNKNSVENLKWPAVQNNLSPHFTPWYFKTLLLKPWPIEIVDLPLQNRSKERGFPFPMYVDQALSRPGDGPRWLIGQHQLKKSGPVVSQQIVAKEFVFQTYHIIWLMPHLFLNTVNEHYSSFCWLNTIPLWS